MTGRKRLLLILTKEDRVTRRVVASCLSLQELFEIKGYEVSVFVGAEASAEQIYTELVQAKLTGHPYVAAFAAAHGSQRGVHNRIDGAMGTEILMIPQFALFREARIALCACLEELDFGNSVCSLNHDKSIPAVKLLVGYVPKLKIFPRGAGSDLLELEKKALERMMINHAECIAEVESAEAAVAKLGAAWIENIRQIPKPDLEFGLMWCENRLFLRSWDSDGHRFGVAPGGKARKV